MTTIDESRGSRLRATRRGQPGVWILRALVTIAPLAIVQGGCSSSASTAEPEPVASTSEAYEFASRGPCAADVLAADTNGDGRNDYVELGAGGVRVSLANGIGFDPPSFWTSQFGASQPSGLWPSTYVAGSKEYVSRLRTLADVNGDRMADLIGFAPDGVYVATSTGAAFTPPQRWVADYGANQGWTEGAHERIVADVDADGLADVVGIGGAGVYVSRSTGTAFEAPQLWLSGDLSSSPGWTADRYPRFVADVNGDGRGDLVGFEVEGVWVSLSTGASFAAPALWVAGFGANQGYTLDAHVRTLADVNGDGKMDVVGFWNDGVYVSLSTGTSFTSPALWSSHYSSADGWSLALHVRTIADVDGDHRGDIVGFGDKGVFVSTSTGTSFVDPALWSHEYGASSGWQTAGARPTSRPRLLTDFNGDGKADIIGLGTSSLRIAPSKGTTFGVAADALAGVSFHSCKPAVCSLDPRSWSTTSFEETLRTSGCSATWQYSLSSAYRENEHVALCPTDKSLQSFLRNPPPGGIKAKFSATMHDECLPIPAPGKMWVFWGASSMSPGTCDNCQLIALPSDEISDAP